MSTLKATQCYTIHSNYVILTLNQPFQQSLEAVLTHARIAVRIIVIKYLVGSANDLKLIRRDPEAVGAVNQKCLINGQRRVDVEIRQVDGRIVGNVE